MKNLILTVAVLGATSLATGCTSSSFGTVTASWDLQDYDPATGNTIHNVACPTGADTAIVYALPAGDQNLNDADKDLFDCAAGIGSTAGHLAGSYQVWVAITDHSGAVLYAQSDYDTISISDGTDTPDSFGFQVNRGFVSAGWTLHGATSGTTLSCSSAGVAAVEMDNMVGTGTPISDQFDCGPTMSGTANPLLVDTYAVALQAIDSSTPPVGLGPAASAGTADIQWGNQLVDKGTVVLSVDNK
jgi:hypothetical protein